MLIRKTLTSLCQVFSYLSVAELPLRV